MSANNTNDTNRNVDYTQRVIQSVPAPLWDYIPSSDLWEDSTCTTLKYSCIDKLKQWFFREGRMSPLDILRIATKTQEILKNESNLLILQDPITVVGDSFLLCLVHGQFYDLMELLRIGGEPTLSNSSSPSVKYLFLGDYVDRGMFGCEVCLLLFCYKILYPESVFMLRGNHECRHLTAYFNFKQECLYKYNLDVYNAIMECFDCLPLGALLNGRFLCVHGGLSPEIKTIDEINFIDRFREPPSSGAFCDILWSDPMDEEEEQNHPEATFLNNELRGCSYVFSYNSVNKFLKANNLLSVIRAHEAQDEGYKLYKKSTSTGFPTVICIFSAPNYCDCYGNKGAIIKFQNNLMNIRQFNCSPHPYYLPNFLNAFNWSLPFVVEKMMDMTNIMLNLCEASDEEDSDDDDDFVNNSTVNTLQNRADAIRAKIRTIGRMQRIFSILREEQENVVTLKGIMGTHGIPQGLLTQGKDALRTYLANAQNVKHLDEEMNEKRPPLESYVHDDKPMDQDPVVQFRRNSLGRVTLPPLDPCTTAVDVVVNNQENTMQ